MEACGEERQVKLLGTSRSPFVVRVRIALALKGIDYEFIQEDMQNKSQLLLQSNPVHKKIPVLIDNGKPVCESMIVVQYIEDAWNTKEPNLIPKDPYDQAKARFWVFFIEDKLFPSVIRVIKGQGEQQQKAVEESVANFLLLEEALKTRSRLSRKAYFGGDDIGLVDIALGGILVFIKTVEKVTNIVLIDTGKMPLLSAWVDQFSKADGVKEVLPDPVELFEFLSGLRIKFTSPPATSN